MIITKNLGCRLKIWEAMPLWPGPITTTGLVCRAQDVRDLILVNREKLKKFIECIFSSLLHIYKLDEMEWLVILYD